MKNNNVIKVIALTLLIVALVLFALVGVKKHVAGVWVDTLKEYNYGMELNGYRELRFTLDRTAAEQEVYVDENGNVVGKPSDGVETRIENTGISLNAEETTDKATENTAVEKAKKDTGFKVETRTVKFNEDADVTKENFDKTKKIIQKRLETLSNYEYNIRVDDITGDMVIELPDDDRLELEQSLILTRGSLEVFDHQTGVILLDNDDIKNISYVTSQLEDGSVQAYMNIKLNDEGSKILTDLSKKYIETVDGAGNATTKYVSVRLDDQTLISTYFGEEVVNGELNVPMGQPSFDNESYVQIMDQLVQLVDILNGEEIPLKYQLADSTFVNSDVTDSDVLIFKVAFYAVIAVVSIVLIVKYKSKGYLAALLNIGFIALLSLVIRYTQITITLNAVIAFVGVVIINYVFMIKFLKGFENNTLSKVVYKDTCKEFYVAIVPAIIVAVIFTFMKGALINSIGMVIFWGLLVQALYNLLFIRALDTIN